LLYLYYGKKLLCQSCSVCSVLLVPFYFYAQAVLFCSGCPVLVALPWLSFLTVLIWFSCSPVPVMSGQSCPSCLLLAFWPGCTVLTVLSWQPFLPGRSASPVLVVLSSNFALNILSWQTCSAGPVEPFMFCLLCSACYVLPVMFCLLCSACYVLPVMFCLSCSACYVLPVNSVCPVLAVMSRVETKMPFTILRKCVFVKILVKSSLKNS
jgi:hypothetical protein